jgi:hypothetical protein
MENAAKQQENAGSARQAMIPSEGRLLKRTVALQRLSNLLNVWWLNKTGQKLNAL